MKNLRQHPIEHLRGVIPGIRPFPDAADVFAEPVEKYVRHLLPLVTIDLALLAAQVGASEPSKRIITGFVIVAAVIVDTLRQRRAKV